MDQVFTILGNVIYLVMFLIALWGGVLRCHGLVARPSKTIQK